MIPNNATAVTREGALGGEKKQMSIAAEDMKYIMTFLTDMYSDPEMAVIREYSANALDSHVMAGTKRPIEISTPTPFSAFYKIKDYGLGLSKEEMQQVYAMYGSSTKRETNDAIGSFGLGSKSALTYTNTFTVTAVKDGRKITVALYRDEDGTGTSEIVVDSETSEPNSVEVVVPVKNHNSFFKKSMEFFRFWAPGTVLVDGQEPERFQGSKVATVHYTDGKGASIGSGPVFVADDLDRSYIVMGQVAYPIKDTNYDRVKMVAYVPIGAVAIAPNREEMIYQGITNLTINYAKKEFLAGLERVAKAEIAAEDDPKKAYLLLNKWRQRLGNYQALRDVKFKNKHQFLDNITISALLYESNSYYRTKAYEISSIKMDKVANDKYMFVTGFDLQNISPTNRKKIEEYASQNGLTADSFLLVNERPKPPVSQVLSIPFETTNFWLSLIPEVNFADIRAIKLPKTSSGSRKTTLGSWDQYIGSGKRTKEITSIAAGSTIIFCSGAEPMAGYNSYGPGDVLQWLPQDIIYLNLGANRVEKFQRDFPGSMHIFDWLKKEAQGFIDFLSDNDKHWLALTDRDKNVLKCLDETKVKDKELAANIRAAKSSGPDMSKWDKLTKIANRFGNMRSHSLPRPVVGTGEPFKHYPLLETVHINSVTAEHIHAYVNAVTP